MSDKYQGGILAGSTSVSIDILLRKKSDNTELTALLYNTSGNIGSYRRQGGSRVAITMATQTVTGAWSSGGFVEIDATNMPGMYRFDLPDAAFATGADYVDLCLVTTNGYAYYERIPLTSNVIQSGDAYARIGAAGAGLTALGDTRVAYLDAAVSTRGTSTYTGADTAGTTTLLARLTATRAGLLDYLDAAITSRSTYAGLDTSGVTTLLARLTAIRAGLLDNLDVAVSSRGTSTYAGADTAGTATLLARLTATRAGLLDNLDAAISGIPGSVWNALTSALTTVGSIGKLLATNIDAAISSRTKPADTQAAVTLVATTTAVTNDVGITQAGADRVWSSAARSLTTFGTLVADGATAVWGYTTRVLTAGTNIVLAKGAGVTGFTDLDAAAVRTALGVASANLDTQLATHATEANATANRNTVTAAVTSATSPLATEANATINKTAILAILGTPAGASLAADLLTKLATSGYTAPLSAAGVRTALGLGSANLDTQLGEIAADTDTLITGVAAVPTSAQNADRLLGRKQSGGSDGALGNRVMDMLAKKLHDNGDGTATVTNEDGTTYTLALTRLDVPALVSVA